MHWSNRCEVFAACVNAKRNWQLDEEADGSYVARQIIGVVV